MEYTYFQLVVYFVRRVLIKLNGMFQQMFMLSRHAFIPRLLIYLCIIAFALYILRRVLFGSR